MAGSNAVQPLTAVRTYHPQMCTRTLLMVLTHISSERLGVALGTWMRDAAAMGYDIALIVSAPPEEAEVFSASLPPRVHLANSFSRLNRSDSPHLERWKIHSFFVDTLGPQEFGDGSRPSGRHDWFVGLDDDTLPEVSYRYQRMPTHARKRPPVPFVTASTLRLR